MKNIRNIIAIILFILVAKIGMAQQEPMLNLYHQNNFIFNPANTGDQDYLQAFVDIRNQWSGIEGNPKTSAFGIHDRFSDKVGLGVLITSDRTGLIERLSGSFNYSYKLKISEEKNHNVTFGLGLGFLENKIDFSNVEADDMTDNIIVGGNYDAFAFNAIFGMKYNFKNFEFSAAIPQIMDNDIAYNRNGADDFEFGLKRHYLFFSSYKFGFYGHKFDEEMNKVKTDDEKFYIKPSVLYKMLPGTPAQLDANLVVGNSKDLWAGFTYRHFNESYIVSGGLTVFNLGLAYAYQIATTDLTMYSNGTHEIMISYKLKKAQEEEDKLNKDILDLMENQNKMKTQLKTINTDVNSIKEDVNDIKQKTEDSNSMIEEMENGLKTEIDSLRNMISKKKSSDGSVIIESDNEQLNQLRKELDELKKYVLQITGENVVELKSGKDKNNNDVLVETPVENGCYVIIHSFRSLESAQRAVKITSDKGEWSGILFNKDRKWYYIYTHKYDDLEPALEKMRETRKGEYDDSWVHIYRK